MTLVVRFGMILTFALAFICASLRSAVSIAATEYLPPTNDPAEQLEQVNAIQQILPFSTRNSATLIQIQHNGVEALRGRFPDYTKWAAEKPDPITITIEQKSTSNQMSFVLNANEFDRLQKAVIRELNELQIAIESSGGIVTLDLMRQKTLTLMGQGLLLGGDSLRGLITGFLQVLPTDKKSAIFKSGDPAIQLKMIRDLNLTDEVLRGGAFQSERFGLNPQTVTVYEILNLIESKLNVYQEFLVQVGMYLVLERISENELVQLKSDKKLQLLGRLMANTDFGFLEKGDGEAFLRIESQLVKIFPQAESKLKKALAQTVAAIPKPWFERKMMAVEVTQPYIKVVEVHPYLGVYRGCIGGDCSTNSSPMYPYSPWEHDYYILGSKGEFLGYISATRVEITPGNRKALYLKDMSGRTLSADVAEVILHAFAKAYSYYGVDAYLVANSRFTDSQNHFQVLRDRFAKYNGRAPAAGTKAPEIVNVTFPDAEVRNYIQTTSLFYSTASYDSPNNHQTGAVFSPQIDMRGYKVSYRPGTLSAFQPQTPRESLIFALRLLSADENAKIGEIPGLVEPEVRGVLQKLKNSERHDLATYYKRLAEVFGRYGIELSRSFRQQQENFFIEGHIMASDAFSTIDDSMRVDSEKFFVTFCRRTKDFIKISNLVKKWSRQLNDSKRVTDLIDLYANRAENADVMALMTFASEKISRAQEVLKQEKFASRRESILNDYLFSDKLGSPGINVGDGSLTYLRSMIVHNTNIQTNVMEAAVESSLAQFGFSLATLRDRDFLRNFNLALVQTQDAFIGDTSTSIHRLLFFTQEYEEGRVNLGTFLSRILQLHLQGVSPKAIRAVWEHRAEALRKAPGENENFALEAYMLGLFIQNKKDLVPVGHFAPAMNALIRGWKDRENKSVVAPKSFLEIHDIISRSPIANYSAQYFQAFQNVETYLTKVQKGTLPDFYKNLEAQLRILGTETRHLWDDPVLRRDLVKMHVGYPEAFDVKNKESFDRTMAWTTEMVLAGEDFELPIGLMIKNLKTIDETAQFKKFVQIVIAASEKGSSPAVFRVLVQLLAAGAIDQNTKISTNSLQELMKVDDPFVKTFAAIQLYEKNPQTKFSTADLRTISTLLANGDEDKLPDALLVFSAKAMDLLFHVRVKDDQIQKELLETISEDDNMKMVLKAAVAYIKNGGDGTEVDKLVSKAFAQEDKRLAKKELKNAKAQGREVEPVQAGEYLKRASASIKLLNAFYQRVLKDPAATMTSLVEGGTRSCELVFLKAKFLGF